MLTLVIFAGALLALAWLSGQIALEIQRIVYHITRSIDYAIVGYFLIFLPGIIVHEAAHWLMAKVLGLQPGKFRVWPVRKGKMVGLGSVTTRSGGPFLDSLVGMAPLLVGTVLVGILSRMWFSEAALAALFASDQPGDWWQALVNALRSPDAPLWLYLVFTIANGMMPSAPDREPVKPLLVYIGLAALVYFALGLPLTHLASALDASVAPLLWLNSALVLTVALDIVVVIVLIVLRVLTDRRIAAR